MSLGAKIVGAATRPLSLPYPRRFIPIAGGEVQSIEVILVRVTTEDGVEGYSYSYGFGPRDVDIIQSAYRLLGPVVVGSPLSHVPRTVTNMLRRIVMLGSQGVTVIALSTFDLALQDAVCRTLDVSLADLLGRRRDSVPVYWSGFFMGMPDEVIQAEAAEIKRLGIKAAKMRIRSGDWADDLRRIAKIREMLPDSVGLMVDAAPGFTATEAVRVARDLAGFNLIWFEEPVAILDHAGLAEVCSKSEIPIAVGESEYMRHGLRPNMDAGARYILADLQRVGGIREWQTVAALCADRGIVLTPHTHAEVARQLNASLDQSEVWLEYVTLFDPLSGGPLEIVDGEATVPADAGSGLQLDLDGIEQYATDDWASLT